MAELRTDPDTGRTITETTHEDGSTETLATDRDGSFERTLEHKTDTDGDGAAETSVRHIETSSGDVTDQTESAAGLASSTLHRDGTVDTYDSGEGWVSTKHGTDSDGDGRLDRVDTHDQVDYNPDGTVAAEHHGTDTDGDGLIDHVVGSDGSVQDIVLGDDGSTTSTTTFADGNQEVDVAGADGSSSHSRLLDTDGDGQLDRFETTASNADGSTDTTLLDDKGLVTTHQADTDGDGTVDDVRTQSVTNDGTVVESWSNAQGSGARTEHADGSVDESSSTSDGAQLREHGTDTDGDGEADTFDRHLEEAGIGRVSDLHVDATGGTSETLTWDDDLDGVVDRTYLEVRDPDGSGFQLGVDGDGLHVDVTPAGAQAAASEWDAILPAGGAEDTAVADADPEPEPEPAEQEEPVG